MSMHRSIFASGHQMFRDLYVGRNINQSGKCKVRDQYIYFLSISWQGFSKFKFKNLKMSSENNALHYSGEVGSFFRIYFLITHCKEEQSLKGIFFRPF